MSDNQLPLFKRKTYKGIVSSLPTEIQAPAVDNTILQTLPAYHQYLVDGEFSKYTPADFTGDLKKFRVFTREKVINDITDKDIHAWISLLKTSVTKGEGLIAKTVGRKLTTLGNYFSWLVGVEVLDDKHNPMWDIKNTRISSPVPEIIFEDECKRLLAAASSDPRTYLLFSLLLEAGIKLEVFGLKVSHFDFSDKYSPEVHIRHTGKKERKSRKLSLPAEIAAVFSEYVHQYTIDDVLFPYTQRFLRYLITDTAQKLASKRKCQRRFCGILVRSGS